MQTFKKIVIYFLLWSFGILTFPVILFLNWKNKDKNYKNYLVASGIGFGMFLIVLPFTDEPDTASTQVGWSVFIWNSRRTQPTGKLN